LPQRGTVSAAALDLALCLSRGKIFFTGIDLAHRDLLTHARPYSFDRLQMEKAVRFAPYYSQCFERSSAISDGGSYGIYASWFKKQLENYPKRLFSLGANNAVFRDMAVSSFDSSFASDGNSGNKAPVLRSRAAIFTENPVAEAVRLLKKAMGDHAYSKKLLAELTPLLFPCTKPHTSFASRSELEEKIESCVKSEMRHG
jgi:hypothetical protein